MPERAPNPPREEDGFAAAVRRGLAAAPRDLPQVWHYDALGSTLFEAICLLPEYDLTRIEDALLASSAEAVVARLGAPTEVVELGSGVASKTVAVLRAAFAVSPGLRYRPIDVSAAALDAAERGLAAACPGLNYAPLLGDYVGRLAAGLPPASGRRLAMFLGSNIGNYRGDAGVALLGALRRALAPGDGVLLGAALRRPREELLRAYDDPTGVTAAFNRNVLGRINRELGGDFDLRAFDHVVDYDEASGVVDSYLVARGAQRVAIAALDLRLEIAAGERIHTESSCKYGLEEIRALGEAAGLTWTAHWSDVDRRFCDALFTVPE